MPNLKVDVVLDLLYKVLHLADNQLTLQQRWIQLCPHVTFTRCQCRLSNRALPIWRGWERRQMLQRQQETRSIRTHLWWYLAFSSQEFGFRKAPDQAVELATVDAELSHCTVTIICRTKPNSLTCPVTEMQITYHLPIMERLSGCKVQASENAQQWGSCTSPMLLWVEYQLSRYYWHMPSFTYSLCPPAFQRTVNKLSLSL